MIQNAKSDKVHEKFTKKLNILNLLQYVVLIQLLQIAEQGELAMKSSLRQKGLFLKLGLNLNHLSIKLSVLPTMRHL